LVHGSDQECGSLPQREVVFQTRTRLWVWRSKTVRTLGFDSPAYTSTAYRSSFLFAEAARSPAPPTLYFTFCNPIHEWLRVSEEGTLKRQSNARKPLSQPPYGHKKHSPKSNFAEMGAPFKDGSSDCVGLGKNLKVCRYFGDPRFCGRSCHPGRCSYAVARHALWCRSARVCETISAP
jgi:hypothetical protein